MIHPSTELRLVNPEIGYGVFATRRIPRGTVVYAQDELEIRIDRPGFERLGAETRSAVDKYSYIAPTGERILSWDIAKYVNHSCACNTMSTGWGFEIALRDIDPGEEITDDYGLFNLDYEMPVSCGCADCRRVVRATDLDTYFRKWDRHVARALARANSVEQPLLPYLPPAVWQDVQQFLAGEAPYRSVLELKCRDAVPA